MKRFKYGLNSQIFQTSVFQNLTCMNITEVSPGDTVSGSVTSRVISESTSKPIMNRSYFDQFSFYVPYRLLWDYWPEFIAGGTDEVPPTLSSFAQTYRLCLLKGQIGAPAPSFNAFGVRAYNLIYNQFFRDNTVPPVDVDTAQTQQRAPLRATTFNQRLKTAIELEDQVIDSTGPDITTGDIRRAFSQDRFDKTRAYYGNKYTDYLAALGVEASWSILDEPELIGKSSSPLNVVMTDATGEIQNSENPQTPVYVGSVGSKWQGTNKHTIRRTFAPEHGLIITLGTIRMDTEYANSVGAITNTKLTRDQWYSPEFETERKQAHTPYYTTENGLQTLYTEKYDDLRVGQNITDTTDLRNGTWIEQPEQDDLDPAAIRYPDVATAIMPYLNDQYQGIVFNHINLVRLSRQSPVRPAQSVHGVS